MHQPQDMKIKRGYTELDNAPSCQTSYHFAFLVYKGFTSLMFFKGVQLLINCMQNSKLGH